jgi:hypothetical protein
MSVSFECCVVRYGTRRRANHSTKEVLPGVVCLRSWHPDNEETLTHQGLLHQGKKIRVCFHIDICNRIWYYVKIPYYALQP